jgi:serine/threonine protein kinase
MTPPHHPNCYSRDQLQELLVGNVSDADSDAWLHHLEKCAVCRSSLEAIAGEDEDWSQARNVLVATPIAEPNHSEDPQSKNVVLDAQTRNEDWIKTLSQQLLSPPAHPELLGRLGRYDIERLLGSGGMGVVFKGFDTELHRTVAIKVLAPSLAFHGAARHRFAKEARAAAAVVHEDVVPIYDVDANREVPFLVMRYIPGESLQARINRVGPLELKQILRIGKQVTSGLAAAHAQGLIHRDVKPANILLEEGIDRALLSDFGLAQTIDDANLTVSGILPGTPQFMSPEQARGEKLSVQSDLFSAGSVLYTMCTGRPPFRSESPLGVLKKIGDSEPTPIRELNPEIPEWLSQIVRTMMAKKPAERFTSASEVSHLLEQCLAHVQQPLGSPLPESLQPPSVWKSLYPRIRSYSLPAILAILLIGIVSGVLARKDSIPVALTENEGVVAAIHDRSLPNATSDLRRWNVVPLPPTPEDAILNSMEEIVDIAWNEKPLEEALAELLSPNRLDYRGNATQKAKESDAKSFVQLRHRTSRKQILHRILAERQLGYIVHPSGIEIADLDYVRAHPTLRRYCLSYVSNSSLEATEVLRGLERMLNASEQETTQMTLNGTILLVRATEMVHDQITQLLAMQSLAVEQ